MTQTLVVYANAATEFQCLLIALSFVLIAFRMRELAKDIVGGIYQSLRINVFVD